MGLKIDGTLVAEKNDSDILARLVALEAIPPGSFDASAILARLTALETLLSASFKLVEKKAIWTGSTGSANSIALDTGEKFSDWDEFHVIVTDNAGHHMSALVTADYFNTVGENIYMCASGSNTTREAIVKYNDDTTFDFTDVAIGNLKAIYGIKYHTL